MSIIDEYGDEFVPYKHKKKKPKTKKSDHKHLYNRVIIKEEKWPNNYTLFKDKTFFHVYKECSICNKIDPISLPDYIETFLKESSAEKTYSLSYYFHLDLETVKKIEANFPEITVIYLDS